MSSTEALIVEISQKKASALSLPEEQCQAEAARNVSFFFGIRSVGTLITAYLSGILLEYLDKHVIFMITSIFPLLLVFAAQFLREDKHVAGNSQERKLDSEKI